MRRMLIALSVCACVIAFPGCKSAEEVAREKTAAEADMKVLEGKWVLAGTPQVEVEEGADPVKVPGEMRIENGIWKSDDADFPRQKVTVYPLKTPKQIDLVAVKEDEKTPEIKERRRWVNKTSKKAGYYKTVREEYKRLGVYKIEGDTLTVAFSYDDSKRPDEVGKHPERQLITYKKVGGVEAKDKDGKEKDDKDKKDADKKDKDDKKDKEKKKDE